MDLISSSLRALSPQAPTSARQRDDRLRFPPLYPSPTSARESDEAKTQRLRQLRGARIRYASPAPQYEELPRLQTSSETDNDRYQALRAMESALTSKQAETAKCFRALSELHQYALTPPTKTMLQQIFSVLFRATYEHSAQDRVSEIISEPINNVEVDIDPVVLDELAGYEYFSLYAHVQSSLATVENKQYLLETQYAMECTLERDLVACVERLDQDLAVIRTQHRESHDRVQQELLTVAQLDDEYAMLITHEEELRKEVDGLTQQLNKQETLLENLHSKSTYLDFVSRVPLKKHMEEKKRLEQEEALEAIVRREEDENQRLEQELARLDAQMESLETQYVHDVERHKIVEQELGEADRLRDQEQLEFGRIRQCHTPRPSWDQVISETPELSSQRFDWDLLLESATTSSQALMQRRLEAAHGSSGDSVEDSDTSDEDDDDLDDDDYLDDEANGDGHGPPRVTTTQQLVREILQWIERLQKHCGVNLHLSRIWHDIEAARVELNILHHQLERAMRKRNKFSLQNAAVAMGIDLAPGKKNTKQEYIVALGIHDEIPPFLRHQGKIKYRALKKSDIENFVRKVWVEKRKRERRNPLLRVRLEEIIYEKLQRKYGFQPLVAEWGYNTLLALNMFAWDAEIELFLLCLTDAVSDQVYVDQEVMIQTCHALLLRLSTTYYNESFVSERRVLLKDALVTLRKFFPLKTSIQLQALEKAMIRDMHKMKRGGNDSILYIDDIFPMNMSYPRGFFVKTMRTQHFKEIQEYYSHLVSEMEARDTKRTGELLVAAVKEAMLAIDPLADPNAVYAALMRGVGAKTRAQLKMYEIVNYRGLLRKMNRTGLLKFALNFDPRAEVNWQRRKSVDITAVPANTESSSEPLPRRVSVMPTRPSEDASS